MLRPLLRKAAAVAAGLVIVAAFTLALSFDNPLDLKVTPAIAQAPADIIVQARVWPSDQNFGLIATITSEDGEEHHSGMELEGSHEQVAHRLVYRGVGPGDYAVEVCLLRKDKMVCDTRVVHVEGR